MLELRMVLYALFAGIATISTGISFDPVTGDLTMIFNVNSLTQPGGILVGVSGYVGTFLAGRRSKARGGRT